MFWIQNELFQAVATASQLLVSTTDMIDDEWLGSVHYQVGACAIQLGSVHYELVSDAWLKSEITVEQCHVELRNIASNQYD